MLVLLAWLVGAYAIQASLGHQAMYSGVTLLVCLIGLLLIGLRKRLTMLPLLSVSTWLQVHIYTGLFSVAVYAVHVPAIIAGGRFEGPLSCLFVIVAASGFYGLYLSRTAPRRLTAIAKQVRYDQIDWHQNQIVNAAANAVTTLPDTPARAILQAFYEQSISPYLNSSLPLAYRVCPTGFYKRRLLSRLSEADRYLDPTVAMVAGKLAALIRQRDDLNYQHAIQFRLRAWVILHAGLSVVLVIWAIVHAYLAFGMLGS